MIEAELPDGRVLEFPDGTDPTVIQSTVKKMLGVQAQPQQTGALGMFADMARAQGAELPTEADIQNFRRGVDSGVRAITRGVTLGGADELSAAANTYLGRGGSYDENLAAERERDRAFDEAHPVLSPVLQTGGAVLGTAAPLSRVAPAATLPGRMFQAAKIGGGLGGITGFLSGEGGFENRATEGAKGAAIGAIAGPILQAAGEGVGSAFRGARNYLGFGGRSEDKAARLMQRALERDRTSPERIAEQIAANRRSGIPSDVIDVAGENTAALARAVAGAPGQARNAGMEFVRQRGRDVYNATDDALLRAVNPEDFIQRRDVLINRLTNDAREAYRRAWEAVPTTRSREIDQILNTPAGQAALRSVLGRPEPGQASALGPVTKTAQGPVVESYFTRTLHQIKKELWDMGARAKANALTGGDTSESAYFKSLSTRLGNALKEANPAYREAAEQYADDAALMEALKEGSERFFRMRPEEIRQLVRDYTPDQREMFLTGVYDAVQRAVLDKTRATANLGAKILDTPGISERLRWALPADRWRELQRKATELSRMYENTRMVGSRIGSQTQLRAADIEDAGNQVSGDLINAAANTVMGRPGSAVQNVMSAVRRTMERQADKARGLDENTASLLSRMLLSNPTESAAAFRANETAIQRAMREALDRRMRAQILAAGVPAGLIGSQTQR